MSTDNVANFSAIPRAPNGKFAKGGPGRPKGAIGKHRGMLEQVRSFGPAAISGLYEAVIAKERWAIEFVLSKLMPNSRTLDWHGVSVEDISEALKDGDISISEFKDLVSGLEKAAQLSEVAEITERLRKLEEALSSGAAS